MSGALNITAMSRAQVIVRIRILTVQCTYLTKDEKHKIIDDMI